MTNLQKLKGMVCVDMLGARWFSVYLPPNMSLNDYTDRLDECERVVRPRGRNVI